MSWRAHAEGNRIAKRNATKRKRKAGKLKKKHRKSSSNGLKKQRKNLKLSAHWTEGGLPWNRP